MDSAGRTDPPAGELVVTLATADDWPEIWPLWQAVVAAGDTYLYDAGTGESAGRDSWMRPAPALTYVARDARRRVVATALLQPNQPGYGRHVANAAFMVHPDHRGHGYGRTLASHVMRAARAAGYTAMQFNAVRADNPAAVALWTSMGFDIIGRVPDGCRTPSGAAVDLLVMFRRL